MFGGYAKIDYVLAGNNRVTTGVDVAAWRGGVGWGGGVQSYTCPSAPQMGELRDKPIVSYVGDTAVMECKMEETKPQPTTWTWYKANGTEKVGDQLREAFSLGFSYQHMHLWLFFF